MILVLAGTSEGRQAALALQDNGYKILVSVTSSYGRELMLKSGVKPVRQGDLEMPALLDLLREGGFDMIVDATHPYATAISVYAMEAARLLGIDYLRLERPATALPEDVDVIDSLEKLPDWLYPGCRVMSTIGSKHLPLLWELATASQAQLIARFLPSSQVVQSCEYLGMSPEQMIAMKGPFSVDRNRALFEKYRVHLVLSKESGAEGGFAEKYLAARELSIPLLVWNRPHLDYPRVFNRMPELVEYIKTTKGCLS